MAFTRSGVRFPSPPLSDKLLWQRHLRVLNSVRPAGIAQLVEHNLAKVGVAGSSPVSRSRRDGRAVTKDGRAVGRQDWFFIGGLKPPLMLVETRQRGFADRCRVPTIDL